MITTVDTGGLRLDRIHIGGIWSSRNPGVVRTILGSCISVCLRDPFTRIGGMNHFMLPDGNAANLTAACYGIHSMELLINACMKLGASRNALEAKVFGGGHVLKMRETDGNVPQSNITFVMNFLKTEGIPILSQDVGGYAAREVYFFNATGQTLMKRLGETGNAGELLEIEKEERASIRRNSFPPTTAMDDVTLF